MIHLTGIPETGANFIGWKVDQNLFIVRGHILSEKKLISSGSKSIFNNMHFTGTKFVTTSPSPMLFFEEIDRYNFFCKSLSYFFFPNH